MTHEHQHTRTAEACFESLLQALARAEQSETHLLQARHDLNGLIPFAREAGAEPLLRSLRALAALVELAESAVPGEAEPETVELWQTIRRGTEQLRAAVGEDGMSLDGLTVFADQVEQRWGDCIALIDENEFEHDGLTRGFAPDDLPHDPVAEEPEDLEAMAPDQVQLILAAVERPAAGAERTGQVAAAQVTAPPPPVPRVSKGTTPADKTVELDDELRQAYLDDATGCLASIEDAILALEANSEDRQPLLQICRELHTLKGASASIGLTQLAQTLHETEESVQGAAGGQVKIDVGMLLERLDGIRREVALIRDPGASTNNGTESSSSDVDQTGSSPLPHAENASTAEASVRVRTSQLDRLMDMLAELVMLRNRRQSGVEQLSQIHGDLRRIMSQLPMLSDAVYCEAGASPNTTSQKKLREVTNDLAEISRLLREQFEPLAADNEAVSGFIGQFRHELVALRRMPIAALFRRMKRVARDAAQLEGKQVRLEFEGEQTGVEGSLQERLYEPLLHLVRNAIGHGIESPQNRIAAGKDPVGRVTLSARRVGHLLQLEVCDDGQGLDYEALRRRGIERGLLAAGQSSSHRELAQLVFHPGFSTRDAANEVAGRGVGMDVVAATLEKMRSWIEIDSTSGRGTTIQMTIPLPTVIEHIMVFACCDQLYGLPMQFIRSAERQPADLASPADSPVHFADLIGASASTTSSARLLIEPPRQTCPGSESLRQAGRTLPLHVDQIAGPEEVVVRPLPPLLKGHSLFSGLTLAGNGEIVLLLDPRTLQQNIEQVGQVGSTVHPVPRPEKTSPEILVVDDSRTARAAVVRALQRTGFGVVEAADGAEALEVLRSRQIAAVFSDIEMPRLSGLELLSQIRATEGWSELPVFIVSSRDEDEFRRQTKRLGATAHLGKPVSEELITNMVDRLLRKNKQGERGGNHEPD